MLLRVDTRGGDHRRSWLPAFCMMSYVNGRELGFVFSYGSLGDLNLGVFGRGVHGADRGERSLKVARNARAMQGRPQGCDELGPN